MPPIQHATRAVTVVAGLAYPAYRCFKHSRDARAAALPATQEPWSDEFKQMAAVAAFLLAEAVLDLLVFWFPLYYEAKFALSLWLVWPRAKLGVVAYDSLIYPLLVDNECHIDTMIEHVSNDFAAWLTKALAKLFVLAKNLSFAISSAIAESAEKQKRGGFQSADAKAKPADDIDDDALTSALLQPQPGREKRINSLPLMTGPKKKFARLFLA